MNELAETSQFYAKVSHDDRWTEDYMIYRYANFSKFVDFEGKNVLDIGCGHGLFAIYCSKYLKANAVIGIDPYEGLGEKAENEQTFERALVAAGVENVTKHRMNAHEIDTLATKVDIVVFDAVLHHIFWVKKSVGLATVGEDITRLFSKVNALLGEAGHVVIRENAPYNWPLMILRKYGRANINFSTKHHWADWDRFIAPAGFRLKRKAIHWPYKLRAFKFIQPYPVLSIVPGNVDLIYQKVA